MTDVDLGTVPVEQARIARHALRHAMDSGAYWNVANYDTARLAFSWLDYRIERAEFESLLLEEPS